MISSILPFLLQAMFIYVLVLVIYFSLRGDIKNLLSIRAQPLPQSQEPSLTHLSLQAHERLMVFVDRIDPSNLILRLYQPGMNATALNALAIEEIRVEFQHNITQQLYISESVWQQIAQLKDDTINLFSRVRQHMPLEAEGMDFSKRVLQELMAMPQHPYQNAMRLIKADINSLFKK